MSTTRKSDIARSIIKETRDAFATMLEAAIAANAVEGAEQKALPELKFNDAALVDKVLAATGLPNKALVKAYIKNNWDKAMEPPKPPKPVVVKEAKAKGGKGKKDAPAATTATAETPATEKVAEPA